MQSDLNDKEIEERLLNHKNEHERQEAMSLCYKVYASKLKGYLVKSHKNVEEQADDLVNETFYRYFIGLRRQEGASKKGIFPYLTGIANNIVRDKVKAMKKPLNNTFSLKEVLTSALVDSPEQILISKELRSQIKAIMNSMNNVKCRDLLLLTIDKVRAEDIAVRMGYPNAGVVRVTKYKCRKRLRELMNQML